MITATNIPFIRIIRNILFWIIFTYYHYSGKGNFPVNYTALFLTLTISYGIPCYVNNLLLIPRFLLKHKYLRYVILFVLLLAITTAGSYYSTHLLNNLLPAINYMGNLKDVAMIYHVFPSMLMFSMLAFGKFTGDAIKNQRKLEVLEKQKLEGELENLKSQVNPHFLFNALNTIYGMARRTDKETADAVMKLSDILRHSLYECNDDKIPVRKEIGFLSDYIEFARLRIHDKSRITFESSLDTKEHLIAPLLLIPYVENAIKYGIGKHAENGWVNIRINVKDDSLHLVCINSNYNKPNRPHHTSDYGGIGSRNARRRLELLYPDKYTLHIVDEDPYKVELKMQLT